MCFSPSIKETTLLSSGTTTSPLSHVTLAYPFPLFEMHWQNLRQLTWGSADTRHSNCARCPGPVCTQDLDVIKSGGSERQYIIIVYRALTIYIQIILSSIRAVAGSPTPLLAVHSYVPAQYRSEAVKTRTSLWSSSFSSSPLKFLNAR